SRTLVSHARLQAASARTVRRELPAAVSFGAAAAARARCLRAAQEARVWRLGAAVVCGAGVAQTAARHTLRCIRLHGGAPHGAAIDRGLSRAGSTCFGP